MRVSRHILSLLSVLLMAVLSAGCDVHEFPGEPPAPPVAARCDFIMTFDRGPLDLLTEVHYGADDAGKSRSRADGEHDFRYTISIFENNGDSRVPSRTPLETIVITAPTAPPGPGGEAPDHDRRVHLDLPPGNFRILVWADHVAPGSRDDLYYTTADLASIGVLADNGAHPGNTAWRDAFRGEVSVSVAATGEVTTTAGGQPLGLVEIPMHRPMARYRFITTDLSEFISRYRSSSSPSPATAVSPPITAVAPDPDDYRVVARYTGYMPSVYNAHTDRPTDSRLGVTYDGAISRLDNTTATLASDYVFVNGTDTSVQVALDVYDRHTGQRIASTDPVTVPLRRNRLTIVSGRFLTSTASGGMGINPGFTDDYNIEIK